MNITIRQNMTTRGISQYKDFFFDRGIVAVGGKTIALNCENLCELTGDTDAGADISASFQTGALRLGKGETRVRSVHVSGSFDSVSAVKASYGAEIAGVNEVMTPATTSRVGSNGYGLIKFNGVRTEHGDHMTFKFENVDGEKFDINTITGVVVSGPAK